MSINVGAMDKGTRTWSPVTFDAVDPRITALGTKSNDEKTYIVMYTEYIDGDENHGWEIYEGRANCYRGIQILVETKNIDIHNSRVFVDVPGINIKGEAEWFMKGIDNAPSIYQFCDMVSKYFEDNFDIRDWDDGNAEEGEELNVQRATIAAPTTSGPEMDAAYANIMREMLQSSLDDIPNNPGTNV